VSWSAKADHPRLRLVQNAIKSWMVRLRGPWRIV